MFSSVESYPGAFNPFGAVRMAEHNRDLVAEVVSVQLQTNSGTVQYRSFVVACLGSCCHDYVTFLPPLRHFTIKKISSSSRISAHVHHIKDIFHL